MIIRYSPADYSLFLVEFLLFLDGSIVFYYFAPFTFFLLFVYFIGGVGRGGGGGGGGGG